MDEILHSSNSHDVSTTVEESSDGSSADQAEHLPNQRKHWMWISIILFLLTALVVIGFWFFIWQYQETTEDAYVSGNIVRISSQISAPISSIFTDDTYLVDEGQLIVLLDDATTRVNLEHAKANLAQTIRQVTQLFENVSQAKANVEVKNNQLQLAKQEMERRQGLVKTSGVSVEDFQSSSSSYEVAKANLVYANSQLDAANAQIHGTTIETHPSVELAKADLRSAYLDQFRTQIFSPARGYVAHRLAQVGQWVMPGNALMAVVPLNDIWVDANFKETQLKNMRIGQNVEMTSDTYGSDVIFHGKLVGISAGGGGVFDVLPPQNATGNWIKIIQRVPVRISLHPRELERFPLRLGLSMTVTVKTEDISGQRLAGVPSQQTLYSTDIYEHEAAKADRLIEEIIQKNKPAQNQHLPKAEDDIEAPNRS